MLLRPTKEGNRKEKEQTGQSTIGADQDYIDSGIGQVRAFVCTNATNNVVISGRRGLGRRCSRNDVSRPRGVAGHEGVGAAGLLL